IKKRLAEHLPEYMIPSHFVELGRIPLTPNGKVDRKALPDPQNATPPELPLITKEMLEEAASSLPSANVSSEPDADTLPEDAPPTPISPMEREQILTRFNDTKRDFPGHLSLHQLIRMQMEKKPDSIAAIYGDQRISYGLLDKKSNQLARQLREKGVTADTVVGLMMERSLEMLIGMVAILKAGGAYLPIDPEYPEERISYMLEQAGAPILLTNCTKNLNYQGLFISIANPQNLTGNDAALTPLSKPENLAQLLYTSGTTGMPKGVMIENRSVINLIEGMTDFVDYRDTDMVLSLTTLSFDIFGAETLLPLVKGLPIAIGGRQEQLSVKDAAALIRREQVSVFHATPSALQLFVADPEAAGSLNTLRYLLVAGEKFPGSLLERLKEVLDNGKIFDLYGPSEATIYSTAKDLTDAVSMDIGKPIANTRIYILGRNNALLPIGTPGELCIAGAGLARGYQGVENSNTDKFVVNPFEEDGILYRTGDIASWLPDGNIRFIGRKDHQVQLNGHRIEPGEIENLLQQHEAVEDAVVVVREDENTTDRFLCACIVTNHNPSEALLKEYLARSLPLYMIPPTFVRLAHIPLTPNGKVNRMILETIKLPGSTRVRYVAPQTGMESQIAEIWKDILQVEQVGVYDSFFDLGGNSLDIIRGNRKLREAFNRDISVVTMFRYPTIHSLAGYLNEEAEEETISGEQMEDLSDKMTGTLSILKSFKPQ
ncbi:MAG: amino acid adenylation domain-containing protein, partial [bacterium]|nr:amino acid adenylation domain-containing protein [bacterium]